LDIRKKSSPGKVVRHWNVLSSVEADAPSPETFKARLEQALGNGMELLVALCTAGELGWVALRGPF